MSTIVKEAEEKKNSARGMKGKGQAGIPMLNFRDVNASIKVRKAVGAEGWTVM